MSGKRDHLSEMYADMWCRHDEVRNLYIEQLAFIWLENSTAEATRASVDKKIDIFVKGELAHAREAVFSLLKIASGHKDVTSPANTSSAVSSIKFCPLWLDAKRLLHTARIR